jgi:putative transposase
MPEHHRRSIRLPGFDYTQPGAYFVTIVMHDRANLLGKINNEKVELSLLGQMIEVCWHGLPKTFNVELDEFVIMPNHMHGIILISDDNRGKFNQGKASGDPSNILSTPILPDALPLPVSNYIIGHIGSNLPQGTVSGSLNAVIQNFKSVSTRKINTFRHTPGAPVWQRNYYERVIRGQQGLDAVRSYIQANPLHWELDPETA